MISTLLNYRLYTNNMARTLEQVSSQAQNERAKQYYDSHIGGVSSVDEFLADYKLYSYAMKAYGLEDQIGSKGLMRKVLESDLTDSASFANKLVDKRYQAFAKAFDFSSSSATLVAQSQAQQEALTEAYGERVSRSAPDAARAAQVLQDAVSGATTLSDIADNRGALEVAMRAVGIKDPTIISTDYVRSVFAGTAPSPVPNEFAALKARLTASLPAATGGAKALGELVYDYQLATGNGTSPQVAQANVDYFKSVMANPAGITSAEDLTNDRRLFAVITASVGITESYTPDYIASMIQRQSNIDAIATTNANGELLPTQAAFKAQVQALHDMFRFDLPSPGYQAGSSFVSADDQAKVVDGYLKNYKTAQTKADDRATAVYQAEIAKVTSLGDLLRVDADPLTGLTYNPLTGQANTARTKLTYVLKAFDIDPDTVSLTKLRAVLVSDPSDPNSYVSRLKDTRFSQLAAAFNFDADGKLRPQRVVQDTAGQTETATLYAASFGTDQSTAQKDLVKTATKSYLQAMQSVYSLDTFLANKDAVSFALTAYGVKDENLSNGDLRKILTSDLQDPKSFANAATDKAVAKFAAAFGFETDGSVEAGSSGVQSGASRRATDNLYVLQTLEEQAGETSEGTRLALYALRTAPTITSAYGILADKALFQVVRTALGLPEGMASADIETQVRILDARIDVKDFSDPQKLDRFIARFAGLYDAQNSDTSQNPVLQLFGSGSSSTGIAALL